MHLFRMAPRVYLERFEAEALLLVADRDRLLTVNAAAADLFSEAVLVFGNRQFSLEEGAGWLDDHYDLSAQQCRVKARELLAFGLKQGLLRLTAAER